MLVKKKTRNFIDALRIYVKGGTGGIGYPKFGGVGGKGGDVYVQGVPDHSLILTKKQAPKSWKAGDGGDSKQFRIMGDPGHDLIIPTPFGTTVTTDFGHPLGEVHNEGDTILVARGGAGGCLTNQFSGQRGETHHIRLLLKLIADIGLVGFPNAGKSTLLRAISYAKPKIASYPFTTLHPIIGMVKYNDSRQISMADLPGLIEGAWLNSGMGHKFLRHVERTKLLLFVVDIGGFKLGPNYKFRSAIENIILLNRELELYQPELLEKPCLLMVNKMDLPGAQKKLDELEDQLLNIEKVSESLPEEMQPERLVQFSQIFKCSAKFDTDSIKLLKEGLRNLLDLHYGSTIGEDELENTHNKIKSQLYEKNIKLI